MKKIKQHCRLMNTCGRGEATELYTMYTYDGPMEDAMGYFDQIGCVYPADAESYYRDSNCNGRSLEVRCQDGRFFGFGYDPEDIDMVINRNDLQQIADRNFEESNHKIQLGLLVFDEQQQIWKEAEKQLQLTEEAEIARDDYTAPARDKDGNRYIVHWDIVNPDAETEDLACDWDSPSWAEAIEPCYVERFTNFIID